MLFTPKNDSAPPGNLVFFRKLKNGEETGHSLRHSCKGTYVISIMLNRSIITAFNLEENATNSY